MTRARRTPPEIRKELILEAAIELSKQIGYNCITRDAVAEIAGVSSPTVATYFPRMAAIRNAVIEAAVERRIIEIIAQGMLLHHPRVFGIDPLLKNAVVGYMSRIT